MRGVASTDAQMLSGREILRSSQDSRRGGGTGGRFPGQHAVDREATGTDIIVDKAIGIFFHVV